VSGFAYFAFFFFLAPKKEKKAEFRVFLTHKNRPPVVEQASCVFLFLLP
jgi:hypothetical protein